MSNSQDTRDEVLLFIVISIAIGLIIGGFWWANRKKLTNDNRVGISSPQTEKFVTDIALNTYNFAQVKNVPSGLFNFWIRMRHIFYC